MPKLTTFSAFLALSLGLAAPAQAGQGWTVVEQLLGSFQVKTGKDLNNRAASCIDYQEMSCRCLGKRDWDALTAAQKKEFVGTLRSLVENRYYPRWRKIFGSGKVTFQDEVSQGGDTVVHTRLVVGKKEEALSWRMADLASGPRVVSLAVDNKDLLERLKKRIKARQEKAGFDALLVWMKGKTGTSDLTGNTPIAAVRTPMAGHSLAGHSLAD